MYSRHYNQERAERERVLKMIGIGEVIHSVVAYDERKQRNYQYDITSNAVLIVRATDNPDLIVTQYPARPSRIKRYWADAPKELIMIAVEHTRLGLVF